MAGVADATDAFVYAWDNHDVRARSVILIQRLFRRKYAQIFVLDRKNLIERLALEEKMWLTVLFLILYGLIFAFFVQGMSTETDSAAQRGLHRIYERNFRLADTSDIKTIEELGDFLADISRASRTMQLQSSDYFVNEAEQKIIAGFVLLDSPLSLLADGVSARVDSVAFSISAWVELGSSAGGYVIRKPLKPAGPHYVLSCWGFFVGSTETRLDFGAHDFGAEGIGQDSVVVPSSNVSELHMQTVSVQQLSELCFCSRACASALADARA